MTISIIITYSVKYFDYLNEKSKYRSALRVYEDFYYNVFPSYNTRNDTFLNKIYACSSKVFYDPIHGINQQYLHLVNRIDPTKLNKINFHIQKYILLVPTSQENLTSRKGIYNGTITFKLLKAGIDYPYNVLYFDGKYYRYGERLTGSWSNFVVDYIDPKGYSAVLKENKTYICGPPIPVGKSVISLPFFVKRFGRIEKYSINVW